MKNIEVAIQEAGDEHKVIEPKEGKQVGEGGGINRAKGRSQVSEEENNGIAR